MAALGNGSGSGRDNAIISEAMRGNVPDHIRALQPVRFTGTVGGRQTEIVICVTPDYLAVGSNSDHVRVPLGLPAALRVADAFDMMLPTTRMVDAIYAQADLRLSPRPMNPGPQMSSTDYFLRHDATLDRRCPGRRTPRRAAGGPQEGPRAGQPAVLQPGPRGDLRLAPGQWRPDPAAVDGPWRILRRLQPRHPAGQPDGLCERAPGGPALAC
jgi:hypothetical protein